MTEIVFWQSMITPHQAGLVRALAARPNITVTYVAAEIIEASRAAMGWAEPDLGQATFKLASTAAEITDLAGTFGAEAIHLCQGFRGNGVIAGALPALAARNARIGVMMEAIDQRGKTGWLKKPLYKRQVGQFGDAVEFCLAIGAQAGRFIASCGFRANRIYPFSYFLEPAAFARTTENGTGSQRVIYVGKLVDLKRVDLLIEAFGALNEPGTTLSIVGTGPLEQKLKALAAKQPNAGAIEWLGTLPNAQVQQVIANSDCLVLPSEYDGWGAVVSEAMLAGTPAVCSSACGASIAVEHAPVGGVFASGDAKALANLLRAHLTAPALSTSQRAGLRTWALEGLSADAGASYLDAIIAAVGQNTQAPGPPWLHTHTLEKPQEIKTFVTG